MPRISEFYGIFISMYYQDIRQHHTPHIHIRYGEYKATFSLETGELPAGRLGNRQTQRVRAWIAARRAALEANWQRALRGEPLEWIDPVGAPMNPDIIDLQPRDDYILRLIFEGGEVRDFDVKPYLELGIFRELRGVSYFREAYVEFGSVEWPHGQGLSYDTLYLESVPASMAVRGEQR